MNQRKNNENLIKNIVIDNVSYPIYSKVNSRCTNIIVHYDSEAKKFSIKCFRHISEADYNFHNLESLVLKVFKKANKKVENSSNLILSSDVAEHTIIFFGKSTLLKWSFHYRDTSDAIYDKDNNILTIRCSIKCASDQKKRTNVFEKILSTFLEEYISKKQLVYSALMKINNPYFYIRKKKSAWGTHFKKYQTFSKLSYSLFLVALDPKYIDYVIVHELCHYFHMDHSEGFYQLGEYYYPNFRYYSSTINKHKVTIK
ncbi:M48 family metallopeptidase [Mycoplasmopsis caviae]|uniref:M48 family metallopeptidase n=1 Tax=Mycoplasmopsis caviae TaxID=55603 RepID=A0A3P8L7L1_9BACT|nr:YgjP-like metallopeptidase domain-containing protein [Mycoplasmopsis caviae]UUD34896.1 M48 family metallopeptidase [Mycoplasmopsis caviae]VDR42265.1 Protein of uncharacterised function DUF45 [Mycoplasmopsis caviae]